MLYQMKHSILLLTFAFSVSAVGQPVWTAEELGHQDWINVLVFSPDGTLLASGSEDQTIILRDADTGQELQHFTGHTGPVNSVAFSPDGILLVSASEDQSIRLWNVETGRELRRLAGHTGPVNSVAFSPDGMQLVSASEDQSIRLWDTGTGQELRRFTGHTGPVNSVAFSPDGTELISGSQDQSIRRWNTGTGQELQSFTGHTGSVNSVAFSPNGNAILSGSDDKTARLWRANGQVVLTHDHRNEVTSVAFSPDGTYLVSGSNTDQFIVSDLLRARRITVTLTLTHLSSATFSPDNLLIAYASGRQQIDGSKSTYTSLIKVTSLETPGTITPRRFIAHTSRIYSVTFSPDGSQLASASWDGSVRLWDPDSGEALKSILAGQGTAFALAFTPDGTQLAVGYFSGRVVLIDAVTGEQLRRFEGPEGAEIYSVTFSPDGSLLASTSGSSGIIRLWNTSTGEEVRSISGHTNIVSSMVFSPDGTQLISGSYDRTIRLWDVGAGQELRRFSGHQSAVYSIAISPDGRRLVSGSHDGSIRSWEVDTGQELRSFLGHFAPVFSVDFSPDGTQLISGGFDGRIRRWEEATGRELRVWDHGSIVYSVAVSRDGEFFASAGEQTLKLWAWDAEQSTSLEFSQSIADQSFPRAQPITPLVLPVATGGTAPITYMLTPALPDMLNFDASTRTISGTPTSVTASPVEYTYTATDAIGTTQSLLFRIHVYSPVLTEAQSLPEVFTVVGNYPNPFEETTQLTFDLPWPARVRGEVTDVIGRQVLRIPESNIAAGWGRKINLNGGSLPSGIYLYRLIANSSSGNSVSVGAFVRVH